MTMPRQPSRKPLPLPEKFGYHRLVAGELVNELRRKDLLKHIDAVVLWGSSVKPRKESTGKDIDLNIYRLDRSDAAIQQKIRQVVADFERRFGVPITHLPSIPLIAENPYKLLYSAPDGIVKKALKSHLRQRPT